LLSKYDKSRIEETKGIATTIENNALNYKWGERRKVKSLTPNIKITYF